MLNRNKIKLKESVNLMNNMTTESLPVYCFTKNMKNNKLDNNILMLNYI